MNRYSNPSSACPITGRGHTWKCTDYEKYISRGVCDCGAVRFFAKINNKDLIERAGMLNEKHGREGDLPKGVKIMPENMPEQAQNIAQKKEASPDSTLPPVPPRPEGLSPWRRRHYLIAHLPLIRRYIEVYGQAMARSMWGVKPPAWHRILSGNYEQDNFHWEAKAAPPPKVSPVKATQPDESPPSAKIIRRQVSHGGENHQPSSGLPPGWPHFKDDWPMLTQIEWLKTYREIALRAKP